MPPHRMNSVREDYLHTEELYLALVIEGKDLVLPKDFALGETNKELEGDYYVFPSYGNLCPVERHLSPE